MNKHTGETIDNETEHIKQSIADILLTAKGNRVMRRTYGSNLYKLIDKSISAKLLLQLSCACVIALTKWEPRIRVDGFKVTMDTEHLGQFLGTLEATIKRTNTKISIGNLKIR